MSYLEAIDTILSEGNEERAIKDLLNYVLNQREDAQKKCAEYRGCLRAIHKINNAHIKDEAIDSLSELDGGKK